MATSVPKIEARRRTYAATCRLVSSERSIRPPAPKASGRVEASQAPSERDEGPPPHRSIKDRPRRPAQNATPRTCLGSTSSGRAVADVVDRAVAVAVYPSRWPTVTLNG